MIITRSPLRITLGGGGTDLPSYYKEFGGFLISAAINKYVYSSVLEPYSNGIYLKYSKTEKANSINKIKHPIIKEVLNFYLHRQHETKHVSVSNDANTEQLGSAQKAAFALATKLKDKLEQQSISQENFWSYVKTRFGVESRNQMSEVDWTTLAAELTAASSKKELFQEFIKKIRQIETASQESEVTKPDDAKPVVVEAMPTESVQPEATDRSTVLPF